MSDGVCTGGAYRCAVCEYEPARLGESAKERDLSKHIQTHSLAELWSVVLDCSIDTGTDRSHSDQSGVE